MVRVLFAVIVLMAGIAACSLLAMFGPFVAFLIKDMRRSMEPQLVVAEVAAIEAPAVQANARWRRMVEIVWSGKFSNQS
jgi:hypothetical protein